MEQAMESLESANELMKMETADKNPADLPLAPKRSLYNVETAAVVFRGEATRLGSILSCCHSRVRGKADAGLDISRHLFNARKLEPCWLTF